MSTSGKICTRKFASRMRNIILGLENSCPEFSNLGIERGGFEGPDQRIAGVSGIDDGVDPKAGRCVTRVGLVLVGGAHGVVQFLFLFFGDLLAFALELLELDFD